MTQKADLIQKSLIDVSASDLEQVEIDGQRERNWHKQSKRYQTDQDIQDAFNEKRLLKVGVTTNYRPITRLLNPANNLKYPPYLKNEALKILNELAHNWRKKLTEIQRRSSTPNIPNLFRGLPSRAAQRFNKNSRQRGDPHHRIHL
jgi:hypothetical protein